MLGVSTVDRFRVSVSKDGVIPFLKSVIEALLNRVEIKNSDYILHN